MDEKKGFHVTVVDNETNEVMIDADTNCVLGVLGFEDHAQLIENVECEMLDYACVFASLNRLVERITEEEPEVAAIARIMLRAEQKKEETQQPDENINETKGE